MTISETSGARPHIFKRMSRELQITAERMQRKLRPVTVLTLEIASEPGMKIHGRAVRAQDNIDFDVLEALHTFVSEIVFAKGHGLQTSLFKDVSQVEMYRSVDGHIYEQGIKIAPAFNMTVREFAENMAYLSSVDIFAEVRNLVQEKNIPFHTGRGFRLIKALEKGVAEGTRELLQR